MVLLLDIENTTCNDTKWHEIKMVDIYNEQNKHKSILRRLLLGRLLTPHDFFT